LFKEAFLFSRVGGEKGMEPDSVPSSLPLLQPIPGFPGPQQCFHFASNWAFNNGEHTGDMIRMMPIYIGSYGAHQHTMYPPHLITQQAIQQKGTVTVPYRVSFQLVPLAFHVLEMRSN
jgi:hypothetical protein